MRQGQPPPWQEEDEIDSTRVSTNMLTLSVKHKRVLNREYFFDLLTDSCVVDLGQDAMVLQVHVMFLHETSLDAVCRKFRKILLDNS